MDTHDAFLYSCITDKNFSHLSSFKKFLSYMTAWLRSYIGTVKYPFFFPKKVIQRTNILSLVRNSKSPSKVKCHLLTPFKIIEVTKRAPLDDYVNVMLMAQGA